jgi:hypothetical protein
MSEKDSKAVEAKIAPANDSKLIIDLETMTAKQIYDALVAQMEAGQIVGIVERCKQSANDRTGQATEYGIKIAFPTQGSRLDSFGNARFVTVGYWLNSYEPIEVGSVQKINASNFAIVSNNKVNED